MNYEETIKLMKRYLLARIPIITFKTIEKKRAINILEELSNELSLSISIHSMSKGTIDLKTKDVLHDDKTMVGALDFISSEIKTKENAKYYDYENYKNINKKNNFINNLLLSTKKSMTNNKIKKNSFLWMG